MKFKNTLENLLGQKSKVKILRFLIGTGLEVTGRELARNIKMDHKTCHRALKELSEQGVILINHTGGGVLYKVNNRNLLVKELLFPFFEKEGKLLKIMAGALIKKIRVPVASAVLFGSLADKGGRPTSDVDILIVVSGIKDQKKAKENLSNLEFDFICEIGNMLSPLVLTVAELKSKIKKKDKLILEIMRNGELLSGKPIDSLMSKND